MRLPRSRFSSPSFAALLLASAAFGCQGNQEGYYSACDEPAGLVLGCPVDPVDDPEFTSWDACMKLSRCGVVLPRREEDEQNENNDQGVAFDQCVEEVQDGVEDLGSTLLLCIETTTCPDLASVDPAETANDDPNPFSPAIGGIVGFCGRLDP